MKPLEVSREGDGDEILGYNMDTVFLEGMTSEKFWPIRSCRWHIRGLTILHVIFAHPALMRSLQWMLSFQFPEARGTPQRCGTRPQHRHDSRRRHELQWALMPSLKMTVPSPPSHSGNTLRLTGVLSDFCLTLELCQIISLLYFSSS
jgi:hypothetical protein